MALPFQGRYRPQNSTLSSYSITCVLITLLCSPFSIHFTDFICQGSPCFLHLRISSTPVKTLSNSTIINKATSTYPGLCPWLNTTQAELVCPFSGLPPIFNIANSVSLNCGLYLNVCFSFTGWYVPQGQDDTSFTLVAFSPSTWLGIGI